MTGGDRPHSNGADPMVVAILARGAWRRGDVSVRWAPSTFAPPPAAEPLIEQAWRAAADRPGVHLFDGPMCRLDRWRAGDRLELELSATSYRLFVGTNMAHPELADVHGPQALANPLGISALLITSDGWLVLGRRSSAVAYYPSRVHPFAGALEPRDDLDVFAAMQRELAEELTLQPREFQVVCCRGIVQDQQLRQPELVLEVTTTRTLDELRRQLDPAEHAALHPVQATPQSVAAALADPQLTPVAVGALQLHLRR